MNEDENIFDYMMRMYTKKLYECENFKIMYEMDLKEILKRVN